MRTPGQRLDYQPDENERAVLDLLREERRVNPLRLREQTGIRKQYVNDALQQLDKLGVVRNVNRGLYEYVPAEDDLPGAEDAPIVFDMPQSDVEELVQLLDHIAQENGDIDAERWVQRLRDEALGDE